MKIAMKNMLKMVIPVIIFATHGALMPTTVLGADYPEAGDVSRGATAWVNHCNRCHNIRNPRELRDDQWITTAFHMRVRGGLTGQETRDIITFLQQSN